MATLSDRIKKNKTLLRDVSGQLVESSSVTPINDMTSQAGVLAPPTTPAGVGMLGGNQHQQKMAGTPAQKQSAMTFVQQKGPDQTLATEQRLASSKRALTAEEEAAKQKAGKLEQLATIPEQVNQAIQAQMSKLAEAKPVQAAVVGAEAGSNQAQLLEKLRANPADTETLAKLNVAMGRAPNTAMTAQELEKLYQSSTAAIAQAGAQAVDNNIGVGTLSGIDTTELSQVLGMTPEQVAGMTVSQLTDAVNAQRQAEFTRTQQAQAEMSRGLAGAAEQAAMRQQLREFSTTGVRSREADVQKIENAVESGETVDFGGKSYEIGELLSDDNISEMITDFINAPTSAAAAELRKSSPALVKFIEDNQAVLKAATDVMKQTVGKLGQITKANQALVTYGNTSLPRNLVSQILPESAVFGGKAIDPQSVPVLKAINALPPERREQAATNLSRLEALNPELSKQVAGLSEDEIRKLDLGNPNSPAIRAIEDNLNFTKQLAAINPNNTDEVLTLLTGTPTTEKELQASLDMEKSLAELGIKSTGAFAANFDRNRDGKVDNAKDVIKDLLAPKSIRDILGGARTSASLNKPVSSAAPSGIMENVLMTTFGPGLKDGKLTSEDVRMMPMSEEALRTLAMGVDGELDNYLGGKDSKLRKTLNGRINKWKDTKTDNIVRDFGVPSKAEVLKDVKDIDSSMRTVDNYVAQLEGLLRIENFDKLYNSGIIKQKLGDLYAARDALVKQAEEKGEKEKRVKALQSRRVGDVGKYSGSTTDKAMDILDTVIAKPSEKVLGAVGSGLTSVGSSVNKGLEKVAKTIGFF
jgi:hypothetical protein